MMRTLFRRLLHRLRRSRADADLRLEMETHRSLRQAEFEREGMAPPEAARASRRVFGNLALAREDAHGVWAWQWAQSVWQDVRYAVRVLAGERWFTVAAVGALALGMGVTIMMVTIVNGYNFRGLSDGDSGRFVFVGARDRAGRNAGVSYGQYERWRRGSHGFLAMAAFKTANLVIRDPGQAPDSVSGAHVSSELFAMLTVAPVVGRGFRPDDDRSGAPPVALLGYRLWSARYAANPSIVGASVSINGTPTTVVGVMPEGFEFPFRQQLWVPLGLESRSDGSTDRVGSVGVIGRLAAGVSYAQARAELAATEVSGDPAASNTTDTVEPTIVRFGVQQVGRFRDQQPPQLLLAAAVFVLLIACANVASLLLARALSRSRELAVRAAIGASRWRIVRQLLVENAILTVAAAAVGLWLSTFAVRFVGDAFGRNVPYWMRFDVDGHVLWVLAAVGLCSTLVFGLVPALFASRLGAVTLTRGDTRAWRDSYAHRRMHVMLSIEFALAVVVLAGAGLTARSFLALYRADHGVDPSGTLTLQVQLPHSESAEPEDRARFYRRLDGRLGELADAVVASVASSRPFVGAAKARLSVDRPSDAAEVNVSVVEIGPRYFSALGLAMRQGRAFTAADDRPGDDVAIVSQRLAGEQFGAELAVGRRIRVAREGDDEPGVWLTVVGVSPTVRQGIASEGRPVVYLPLRSFAGSSASIIIHDPSDPARFVPLIRREIASVNPDVMATNVRSLRDVRDDSRLQHRLLGTLLAGFAVIALLLSTVGLYAVTAYGVVQRRREIGIRVALGARSGDVVRHVARGGLRSAVVGVGLGLIGAYVVGRIVQGLLIETTPTDPAVLGIIAGAVVLAGLAGAVLPARLAARVDPAVTLRSD